MKRSNESIANDHAPSKSGRDLARVRYQAVPPLILGAAIFVGAILANNVLWLRFMSAYKRHSSTPMPSSPIFDFRGRWWRAVRTPSPYPDVDWARRLLMWSYVAGAVGYAIVLAGLLLLSRQT